MKKEFEDKTGEQTKKWIKGLMEKSWTTSTIDKALEDIQELGQLNCITGARLRLELAARVDLDEAGPADIDLNASVAIGSWSDEE